MKKNNISALAVANFPIIHSPPVTGRSGGPQRSAWRDAVNPGSACSSFAGGIVLACSGMQHLTKLLMRAALRMPPALPECAFTPCLNRALESRRNNEEADVTRQGMTK